MWAGPGPVFQHFVLLSTVAFHTPTLWNYSTPMLNMLLSAFSFLHNSKTKFDALMNAATFVQNVIIIHLQFSFMYQVWYNSPRNSNGSLYFCCGIYAFLKYSFPPVNYVNYVTTYFFVWLVLFLEFIELKSILFLLCSICQRQIKHHWCPPPPK